MLIAEGVDVQPKAKSMGDFGEITMRYNDSCCLVNQG